MNTPSIVQQRIILIALFVAIGALAGWQNAGNNSDYPVQKFSTNPLPAAVASLDFTTAEAVWGSLRVDLQGDLKIDARTESALVEGIALLGEDASELPVERMAFLLEKQFGARVSHQVIELLPLMKKYKQAEQRWWNQHSEEDPPPYTDLFRLQDEWMGERLAREMFAEQRRFVKLMLATQQIRNDAKLTGAEKDQALLDLQRAFVESAPNE